jgi:hypothetical protein
MQCVSVGGSFFFRKLIITTPLVLKTQETIVDVIMILCSLHGIDKFFKISHDDLFYAMSFIALPKPNNICYYGNQKEKKSLVSVEQEKRSMKLCSYLSILRVCSNR